MRERMIISRHLSEQVTTTLEEIASSKNTIANLEEKISRLEETSVTLDSSIEEAYHSCISQVKSEPLRN